MYILLMHQETFGCRPEELSVASVQVQSEVGSIQMPTTDVFPGALPKKRLVIWICGIHVPVDQSPTLPEDDSSHNFEQLSFSHKHNEKKNRFMDVWSH